MLNQISKNMIRPVPTIDAAYKDEKYIPFQAIEDNVEKITLNENDFYSILEDKFFEINS
jgi:hypothetical protein